MSAIIAAVIAAVLVQPLVLVVWVFLPALVEGANFSFKDVSGVLALSGYVWLFATGLALCGFMLMGPDSLLAGVGAIDVGGRSGAIVAAGIINGLGSIGPIFQEEAIGWILDHHGHDAAFTMLIGVSLLGIIGTVALALRSRRGLSNL